MCFDVLNYVGVAHECDGQTDRHRTTFSKCTLTTLHGR